MNSSNVQVGHIPRAVASKLADFMDENLITVEGQMIGQNLDLAKHWTLAINISLYGKPSMRETIEPLLISAFGAALLRRPTSTSLSQATQEPSSSQQGSRAVGGGAAARAAQLAADEDERRQVRLKRIMEGMQHVPEANQRPAGAMVSASPEALIADFRML